jgi:hypothetical protein
MNNISNFEYVYHSPYFIYVPFFVLIVIYLTSSWSWSTHAKKKAQITQKRVEYNAFLFDKPFKDSKSQKIFKISLTFRFDKLSNLSKSVHTGEKSQILTASNKKKIKSNFLVPSSLLI